MTKSHIPAVNAPVRIEIPEEQKVTNESAIRLKRGRPIGSKDKIPRKRKGAIIHDDPIKKASPQEEAVDVTNDKTQEVDQVPVDNENIEISLCYISIGKIWNRNQKVVDNIFSYTVAVDIMNDNDDHESKSVEECRCRCDWQQWND